MPNVANVLVHIQPGTGQGGATAPPESSQKNETGWLRAKLAADGSDSSYWYCFSGGNGPNRGGTAGGEVDAPNGGSFSIGPSGNEVIVSVRIVETATLPPGVTSYYTPNPPVAEDGVFTIADAEHADPTNSTDSFHVQAKFNSQPNAPLLQLDPIIRNRS